MKHVKCYIPEYPRPQLVRPSWENLNGEWDFAFGEEVNETDAKMGCLNRKINVPFSYETELSGINIHEKHEVVWYAHQIKRVEGKRTLINFEGADYQTFVYINGVFVGDHTGAYDRFTFDITEYLTQEENILAVKCVDPTHPSQLLGKQSWEEGNFACFYVQTTGIWKTVWLEYVDDVYLTSCKITPDLSDDSVQFDMRVSEPAQDVEIKLDIYFKGKFVRSTSVSANDMDVSVKIGLSSKDVRFMARYWFADDPNLYDVEISVVKKGREVDKAGSYFGLCRFQAQGNKLIINEKPEYLRLCLDQGYWKESGLTPPSEKAIIRDIQLCKDMGFNGVRKHQKNEDERFYYYADIMGFYVWCEMPSNQLFADQICEQISKEWQKIVMQNFSHPSLITWVLYNENWGCNSIKYSVKQQNFANALYWLTKSYDPVRPVVSNDGWLHTMTDIVTLHRYDQNADNLFKEYGTLERQTEGHADVRQKLPFADGYQYEGQPIVFSEFGGAAYDKDTDQEAWGYGQGVKTDEEFLERFGSLIAAIKKMDIAGYCYTQVTDVEQEVNGLLTTDRRPKVDIEEIKKRVI